MPSPPRRFPPPWTVEDKDTYFIVCDHDGQALAYVYAEDKRTGAKPLTRDEARRIAATSRRWPFVRQVKRSSPVHSSFRRVKKQLANCRISDMKYGVCRW